MNKNDKNKNDKATRTMKNNNNKLTRTMKNNNNKNDKISKNNNNIVRDFIQYTMEYLLNIKMYHWTTNSYKAHKITDKLYLKLQTLMDTYVETSLGYNLGDKRYLMGSVKNIKLTKLHNNRDLHKTTKDYKNSLKTIRMKLENNKVDEIIAVLDEITVELDILSYLNTFE